MQYAKKMALVEPRLLEVLQHQQQQQKVYHPTIKVLSDVDRDMQNILMQDNLSEDEKVKLYNQALRRYETYERLVTAPSAPQYLPPPQSLPTTASATAAASPATVPAPAQHVEHIEREILHSIPKTMKKKGEILLMRMKNDPTNMGWTEKGELIVKGRVIPNSNVVDLVNDVLRQRKNFHPTGRSVFAQALKESNVPRDVVGNQRVWDEMMTSRKSQDYQPTPAIDFEGYANKPSPISSSSRKGKGRSRRQESPSPPPPRMRDWEADEAINRGRRRVRKMRREESPPPMIDWGESGDDDVAWESPFGFRVRAGQEKTY